MCGRFRMNDEPNSGWREQASAAVIPHRRPQFDGCGSDGRRPLSSPDGRGAGPVARYAAIVVTPIEPVPVQPMVAPC
jgi:hypothetical protein